jgi:hypothetical protein
MSTTVKRIAVVCSIVALALLFLIFFEWVPTGSPPKPLDFSNMPTTPYQPPANFAEHKAAILESMVNYLNGDEDLPKYDPGYTQDHIERCAALIDQYIKEIQAQEIVANRAAILAAAKKFVIALNRLNEECNGSLIETMQREDLCALIFFGAQRAKLPEDYVHKVDFTEEWREW